MSRVEENKEVIGVILEAIKNPFVTPGQLSNFSVCVLCDISKSLAVIADKMTEEEG